MKTGADQKLIKDELVAYLQVRQELNSDELDHFKGRCIPFLHDIVDKFIEALKDVKEYVQLFDISQRKTKRLQNQLQKQEKNNLLEIKSLTDEYKNAISRLKKSVAVMMEGYYEFQRVVEDDLVENVCSLYEAIEKQVNKPIIQKEAQSKLVQVDQNQPIIQEEIQNQSIFEEEAQDQPAYSLKKIYQLEVIPPVKEVLEQAHQLSLKFAGYFVKTWESRRRLIKRCKLELDEFEDNSISEFTTITSMSEQNITQLIQQIQNNFAGSNVEIVLGQ